MLLRARSIGSVVVGLLLAGCYTLQPAGGVAPELGKRIAFDVNDAGRLALGGSMGPEIDQVEGKLLERTSDEYVLSVSSVKYLRGGHQTWTGESVRIKSDHVATVYTRQFSKPRTIALAAAGGGALALIVTQSLTGRGQDGPTVPGDSAEAQIIPVIPRP
jgi:hypothetical protein